MKDNFEFCLAQVLKHEGGYVNHPQDPGGMTNLGVTKRVWETWLKREVGEMEMRSLTPDLVRPLYKEMYWDKCRCDDLPSGVDLSVFDFGVNSGPKRAIITLQRSVGAKDDGVFGPGTLKAVQDANPSKIISDYFDARMKFYEQLKTYPTFGVGWRRRAVSVSRASAGMHQKTLPKTKDSEPSPSR